MKKIIKRIYFIYAFVVLLGFVIIGQIIYLQFFAEITVTDADISFRQEEIEANRGSILARDSRPLSTSVPYYQIRMDCVVPDKQLLTQEIDQLAKELSNFFKDKSAAAYKNQILKARKEGKRYMAIGNRLVDYSEMIEIKQFSVFKYGSLKGGIITEQKNRRNNPYGRLAYRTIGFINSNGVGAGLEASFNHDLQGIPGRQTVQKVLGGEWIPVISEKSLQPHDGYDVLTTLDIDIQEAAENALKEQLSLSEEIEGATAIVMEVKTGAIRAIANMKKGKGGSFDESYNYAIGHATEPGSTFKLATLVALLEDGYVTLDSKIDAGDGKWRYSSASYSDVGKGLGEITVKEAFQKSSNVAFAKLAVEHYANNEKRFVDRIMNMKITEKFNLEIKGAAGTVIYTPGDAMWSGVSLPSMAIGYATMLTPLHTLTFYNAIANNGKMMKPYFVENIQKNGEVYKKLGPQEISGSICSKKTVELVKAALRGVVEEGTGKIIQDNRYSISGKTGTARIAFDGKYIDAQGYRRHQATFAGFFPSENPKYSAIVVLYSSKTRGNFYGGSWSAPVFKKIADKIYANSPDWNSPLDVKITDSLGTPPLLAGRGSEIKNSLTYLPNGSSVKIKESDWVVKDSTKSKLVATTIENGIIPDVRDMGLKDALYILENMGYRVTFSGKGKVTSQYPQPGTSLTRNQLVEIKLKEIYETE